MATTIEIADDNAGIGEDGGTSSPAGDGKAVPAPLNPVELVTSEPGEGGGFAEYWAEAVDLAKEVKSQVHALELLRAALDAVGCLELLLGGLLWRIRQEGWYAPHETFAEFCAHVCGFRVRKAQYLIRNYEFVVEAGVPWDQLDGVSWTKLREVAARVEPKDLVAWLPKAKDLTVEGLKQALVEAKADPGEVATKKMTIPFWVFPDEWKNMKIAIDQAKKAKDVKHDHQAIEGICIEYMGTPVSGEAAKLLTVKAACQRALLERDGAAEAAVEDVLAAMTEVFTGWTFQADPPADGEG